MIRTVFTGESLLSRFLRGCGWVAAQSLATQLIRTVRLWVLTWLLAPEVFGILALVWCVMGMLREFSDIGIRHALIQSRQKPDQGHLDTAWWLNVVRNVILAGILCFGASRVRIFGGNYANPELAGLLRWCCLILLLEGLSSVSLVVLQKEMRFGILAKVQTATQMIGLAGAVVLGWLWRDAKAVVFSEILATGFLCVISYAIHPYRPRISWDRQAAGKLMAYGGMIYLVSMMDSVGMRLDILLLGKVGTEEEVGIYNLAMAVIATGCTVLSQLAITVGFPVLSSIQKDRAKLREATVEMFQVIGMISLPAFLLIGLFSDELAVLLPEKYAMIGGMLGLLSMYGFFHVLLRLVSPVFYAIGRLRWCLLRSAVNAGLVAIFLVPLYGRYGPAGVCWAVNGAMMVSFFLMLGLYWRELGWKVGEWFRETSLLWRSAASGAVVFLAVKIGMRYLGDGFVSPTAENGIAYGTSMVVYGGLFLRHYWFRFWTRTSLEKGEAAVGESLKDG